ncbi:putative RING finger protein nhl-1-like [Apostichopus japonicus]|uniref:Putative RING finger protein nhl-1-like n=1 Tax=Stichopus japonicus TaxID=307972 RepID=A0A2G8K621_STIJA|nr:putative RING finger protein nhl-1-like [Apostichopus japonicus]
MASMLSYVTYANTAYQNVVYYVDPHQSVEKRFHELRRRSQDALQINRDVQAKIPAAEMDIDLRRALRDEEVQINEFMKGGPTEPIQFWEVWTRGDLRQFIKKQEPLLRKAREQVKEKILSYLLRCQTANNETNTDGKIRGQESHLNQKADNRYDSAQMLAEAPTITGLTGINQPHDVLTLKNEIFVLMDGWIRVYDMSGKEKRVFHRDGFKPFAAVFLGTTLYVTDKNTKCIMVFDHNLNYITSFGKDHLTEPAGITACGETKQIYVLSGRKIGDAVVAIFESDGKYIRQAGHNQLGDPWYIKKSPLGEFVISDFNNKAIYIYSSDFQRPTSVIKTDLPGGRIVHCRGIDVDKNGNIYAALRSPGYSYQYECIVKYNKNVLDPFMVEESPVGGYFSGSKSLNFVRGLHYYRCAEDAYLMIVNAGNNCVTIKPA